MTNHRKKFALLTILSAVAMVGTIIAASATMPLSTIPSMRATDTELSLTLTKDNAVSYSAKANATYSGHYDNSLNFKTSQGNGVTVSVTNSTTSVNDSSNLGNIYADSALVINSEYGVSTNQFQSINSLTISSASTAARTVRLYFNGQETYESISVPARSSATFDATELGYKVRSLKLTGSSASEYQTIAISSLVLNYSCTNNPPQEISLESISVDASGAKTEFTVGETFTSEGIIVTANYSDFTHAVVTPTSISSPDMSSAGTKSVNISYTEGGVTKTTSYEIEVEDAPSGLSGTYAGTYTSIEFTSATQGTYIYGSERLYFTYSISGSTITFTYSSGNNTDFGSYRLFAGGDSPKPNASGSIVSSTQISVKTYNMFDSANQRTFTK